MGWWILAVIGLLVAIMFLRSFSARRPDNLGATAGRLAPCPTSPNCVCTFDDDSEHGMQAVSFSDSPEAARERIIAALHSLPRTKIITSEENYIHAECTSQLFRFVDDVEFLIDSDAKLIHFRSASRVGHSDLGVNRGRMQALVQQLRQ